MLSKGPHQKLQCAGTLLSKGPPNATEMCKSLLSNFIEGPLKETVVYKYSAFQGAPNNNCNV